ncbi:MAG: DsrE family protein [Candidatus Methanoperedens sp.]|nr:DsrE family protein [Candidatus Methanoperedens sp.]MCZ7361617.1 DsrE family protein [Candidatus Methanoperedens sp.]HLB70352.1 DsrE family protein [Candidatus Methanoperedens sp.]
MGKKVNIIITQPPYGKEDAYSAIPMAASQVAAGNEASLIFVSGGVHSIVSGQKTGYGDLAVWFKDVPTVEGEIIKNIELVSFFALDRDIAKRGINDNEIIDRIKKISLEELTDKILEADVNLVF